MKPKLAILIALINVACLPAQENDSSGNRFEKLPESYQYEEFKIDPPLEVVNDREGALKELNQIQNQQWKRLSTIKYRYWLHLANARSPIPGIILTEKVQRVGTVSKTLRWYPLREDRDRVSFPNDPNQLKLLQISLETPQFTLKGDGIAYKGIDDVRIKNPSGRPLESDELPRNLIPGASGDSPDAFLGDILRSLNELKKHSQVRVSRNASLMEVRVWPINGHENDCNRWVFDLTKNGAGVYCEGLPSDQGGAGNIWKSELEKVGDFWLPRKVSIHQILFHKEQNPDVRTRTGKWVYKREFNYFQIEVNPEFDPSEFDIGNLPVGDEVHISDQRTGRGQSRLFGDFKKKIEKK